MNHNLHKICGFEFVEAANSFYVGDVCNNAICECNKTSGNTQVLCHLQGVPYSKQYCFSKSACVDDKILFAPLDGKYLYVYDIEKASMQSIPLDGVSFGQSKGLRYWEIAAYGRTFYIFGYNDPGIVKINSDTLEIESINGFEKTFDTDKEWKKNSGYYFGDGTALISSKFYIPTGLNSTLFSYSVDDDKFCFIKIKTSIKIFLSISGDKSDLWMTDSDSSTGSIAIYHTISGEVQELTLPSEGIWYAPFFHDGYAYFLPVSDGTLCYKVNIETKEADIFHRLDDLFTDNSLSGTGSDVRNTSVLAFNYKEGKVTFIRRPDYTWFTYNFETDELTSATYEITDEEYLKKLENSYYDDIFANASYANMAMNEKDMPLKHFLNRL